MRVEDDQTQVRVAWLYYMEGLTQAEVAARLRVTRLRVNRLLVEARASGLVNISLNSSLTGCIRLEQELVKECGLKDAVIVPTPQQADFVAPVIGRAAGEYVSRLLESNTLRGFGVGWGATLRETIRHVRPGRHPKLVVSSMMGGLTYGIELNTFETASDLASRLGAQCYYLAAPIYAGTPQSKDNIVAQDPFREAFERIAATDAAILSVGDLSRRSLLIRNGLPPDITADDLRAAGAVGDILAQFIDAAGRPIGHLINGRAIALSLDSLRKIPMVILASGGSNKSRVIAAVIKAKLVSVLICDERTATAVLGHVRRAN
jgi:DNA-binding transcriptional regulator LsrR (DeoR family)